MQLVSAPPPPSPFLDTWAPPGAGRRWENQLRELILYPALRYPGHPAIPHLSPAIPPFFPPERSGVLGVLH
eukprot:9471780-Pyramimonas_sp.AAC.2